MLDDGLEKVRSVENEDLNPKTTTCTVGFFR